MTDPEVLGYATHHDEPLLFPTAKEAAAYCDDEETPYALIRESEHEAVMAELVKAMSGEGANFSNGFWFGRSANDAKHTVRLQKEVDDLKLVVVRLTQKLDEARMLAPALANVLAIVGDSSGVSGYHLNGTVASWAEFEDIAHAAKVLARFQEKEGVDHS